LPAPEVPEIIVNATAYALTQTVAVRLSEVLAAAQAQGRVPSIALTGGTIADKVHRTLVDVSSGRVDWSQVHVWWGDERYVPASSEDRNATQARKALLDHVDVSPDRVHEMPASDGAYASLTAAAEAYGEELRRDSSGRFDVVMLGVGPDGHVASLFPRFPQLDVEDTIAVPVTGSPKPPPERITLTFGALNRSSEVWFVASGEEKAEAVARATATGDEAVDPHDVPAAGVRGEERTVWFLDERSASRLASVPPRTDAP
jgi:6-phosphogluconolactonase